MPGWSLVHTDVRDAGNKLRGGIDYWNAPLQCTPPTWEWCHYMAEEFLPRFIGLITEKRKSLWGTAITLILTVGILVWVLASAWTAANDAWIEPIVESIDFDNFQGIDESVLRVAITGILTALYSTVIVFAFRSLLKQLRDARLSSAASYKKMIDSQTKVTEAQKEIVQSQKKMSETHDKILKNQERSLEIQTKTVEAFQRLVVLSRRQPGSK